MALAIFIVVSAVMAGMNWRVMGLLDANLSHPINGLVQGHAVVWRGVRRRLGSSAFMIAIEVVGLAFSLENPTAFLALSSFINLIVAIILAYKAKSLLIRGRKV